MERLLPSHEAAIWSLSGDTLSEWCFHLPPCSQLAGHSCWWQSYMQMKQWRETSLWAPDTMQVTCHYILKVTPQKTHPLLSENKKEPDRQRPGQWIYWRLELPFFFLDKFILFSLRLDPPGVWFIQRNVFPFEAGRVLTRYWHRDYFRLCHAIHPNPACQFFHPLQRNHWMGSDVFLLCVTGIQNEFLIITVAWCH